MTRLTNFVKFQGAILELLQTNCDGNQSPISTALGTTFSDRYTGSSPSGTTTPVLNGEIGGFSGMLKLSIPWKKGSLDIRKVDADLTITPVVLRLQPSTINWIIISWECLMHVGIDGRSDMHHQATELVCLNSASCYHSFTLDSDVTVTSSSEKLTAGICSLSQETTVDASLPGPHVISNWVPLLISKNHGAEAEADYSVSIDQFFECFDGMRSSQAALANTGIWNWSCSVFSAITAASSLASGSVHIPFGSDLKKSLFLVAHPSKELFLQLKASSFFCIREAIVCQPCKLKSLCKFANQRVNKWWNLDLKDALMILFKIHDTLKNFFSWIYRGYRFCYGPHMYADISRCYKSPCVLAEPGIVSTFYSNRILCSHIHKLIFGETCRIMSLPLEILPQ